MKDICPKCGSVDIFPTADADGWEQADEESREREDHDRRVATNEIGD